MRGRQTRVRSAPAGGFVPGRLRGQGISIRRHPSVQTATDGSPIDSRSQPKTRQREDQIRRPIPCATATCLKLTNINMQAPSTAPFAVPNDESFDILDWWPAHQSCQRFFLDHAQHEPATQALCALINIRLPFQLQQPVSIPSPASYPPPRHTSAFPNLNHAAPSASFVSLIPYLRRLVVTGFDRPPILHGFFGDDYVRGVLPHLDCERRNYLFAAKHGGWRSCKKQYDIGTTAGRGDETVPFMRPLDGARGDELSAAEKAWSAWLAMEDWMVGPRAPPPEEPQPGTAGTENGGPDGLYGSR